MLALIKIMNEFEMADERSGAAEFNYYLLNEINVARSLSVKDTVLLNALFIIQQVAFCQPLHSLTAERTQHKPALANSLFSS